MKIKKNDKGVKMVVLFSIGNTLVENNASIREFITACELVF